MSQQYQTKVNYKNVSPVHVMWEATAYDMNSSLYSLKTGKVIRSGLTTVQCFEVIESLKNLGTREITIICDKTFLRYDWLSIIKKINESGMACSIQTDAYNLTEERILAAKSAGIKNISVSINKLPDIDNHHAQKSRDNSFEQAICCLALQKKHNMAPGVNTVITQSNKNELEDLLDYLIKYEVKTWHIQIASGTPNNLEKEIIQPYELIDLYENLISLYRKALINNIIVIAGNNIGYFGPYEHIWRQGGKEFFSGYKANQTLLYVEHDGKIKNSPSLPVNDSISGNVKDMNLERFWDYKNMLFSEHKNSNQLWGGCKNCYYAETCLASFTNTTETLFGRKGNNPFCHYRALKLKEKGLKETIQKIKKAERSLSDRKLYEIVVEDENGNIIEIQSASDSVNSKAIKKDSESLKPQVSKTVKLCQSCKNYVYETSVICDFCNVNVDIENYEYERKYTLIKSTFEKWGDVFN